MTEVELELWNKVNHYNLEMQIIDAEVRFIREDIDALQERLLPLLGKSVDDLLSETLLRSGIEDKWSV